MSPVSLVLNLLWIEFGGVEMAVGWLIAAVIMAITIIGIPWARTAFNIASYALFPFGRKAVSRAEYSGHDIGTGPFGLIGNIIWLVLAGWCDYRHPLRLGASEACWDRALANRQRDRGCGRHAATLYAALSASGRRLLKVRVEVGARRVVGLARRFRRGN
jgi:hypothetical protein